MKRKNYILALLLIMAGLQTAHAQVMKIWQNGKAVTYVVAAVDSLVFLENAYEWVDMGLPSGTLWATCNIGASSPDGIGSNFAWGETEPKDDYSWSTYFDTMDGGITFRTYDSMSPLSELMSNHDAATANWGRNWQMPSVDQMDELRNSDYTTNEFTKMNGVYGRKITSKSNGNSIFLPAAGLRTDTILQETYQGCYWSRSRGTSYSNVALNMYFFYDERFNTNYSDRYVGRSVRPVLKK
ncbi:MAG: hypothetical protein IJK51_09965 [Bacteroidaceae bacterium]|nr:hypothetical protein [Bacteroidaceae bacterium]